MTRPLWDNPSRVQGTILPDYPESYDLGSAELPFRDGYFSGDIYLSGDIVVDELLLANGSAADPSLAFASNPTTGLFRPALNQIGFATNGVQRLLVYGTATQSSVPFYAPNGAEGAPTYAFSSDPDTGMYVSSTNQIAWTTGGSRRWYITSGGQLASDVTNGAGILLNDGTAAAPHLAFQSDADTGLYRVGSNSLGFTAGGVQRAFLDTTRLRLNVALHAEAGNAAGPTISFGGDQDTGFFNAATNSIGIAVAGVESWRFNGSNNLDCRIAGAGIILRSPNATAFTVTVDNTGTLVVT